MSHSNRRIHDLQQVFVRQSVILRNNLAEWDHTLQRCGEDWPNMLGRLNAAVVSTMYNVQCTTVRTMYKNPHFVVTNL